MRYKIEEIDEVFNPEEHLEKEQQEEWEQNKLQPSVGNVAVRIIPLSEDGNPSPEFFYRCKVAQCEIDARINAGEPISLRFCYVEDLNLKEKEVLGLIASNAFFDGNTNFGNTRFGKREVGFNNTIFNGERVTFHKAQFGKGGVSFLHAQLDVGNISFSDAKFGEGEACFVFTKFYDGIVDFRRTKFSSGGIDFWHTEFGDVNIIFSDAEFGEGNVKFEGVKFGRGNVTFLRNRFSENGGLFINEIKAPDLAWTVLNQIFPAHLCIVKCKFKGLALENCTFTNRVDLLEVNVEKNDSDDADSEKQNGSTSHAKSKRENLTLENSSFTNLVDLRRVKTSNLNLQGTYFGKGILLPIATSQLGALANRDTARVLKHECTKQNNRIGANHFYREEMEFYRDELASAPNFVLGLMNWVTNLALSCMQRIYNKTTKICRKSVGKDPRRGTGADRFILEFNQWATNHGQNWPKGVCNVFLVGIVLFAAYFFSAFIFQKPYQIDWTWNCGKFFETLGIYIGYNIRFLNPAHSFDFAFENPNFIAIAIDTFCRVLLAILYSQTIQTFRKNRDG